MYYATHRLYISKNNPLRLHVVMVKQGRVHSFFPFDGERESMMWADTLLLSDDATLNGLAGSMSDILQKAAPSQCGGLLYEVVQCGDYYVLRLLS